MLELKLENGEHLKLVIEGARVEARDMRSDTMIDPAHLAHFFSVQTMLRPEEALATSELAAGFSALELRAWLAELGKLNVAQAVQHVRVLVAGNTEAVS
jgi:hypothetical protein